jgi:hypothetical protein
MRRGLLIAALVSLSFVARAQSGGFQPLNFEGAAEATFERYSLRLAAPDNPARPTMWEGPLTIVNGSVSCSADVSLVTSVYGAPGRGFVILLSTSGSNAIANFIELASCTAKWPPIKRAASSVRVAGNRLSFMPVCEGGGSNAAALCTSARVYAIRNDSPPAYLRSESFKLTAKEVGVGFTGEARVMDPHTPRAMVVH